LVTTEAPTSTTTVVPSITETPSCVVLAKNACTQYTAGVEAINAVISDSNAGRAQIRAAVRAAYLAASEDAQWVDLAHQLESVQADQRIAAPAMARDLATADTLCAKLTQVAPPVGR
jgi:hypothetical protein